MSSRLSNVSVASSLEGSVLNSSLSLNPTASYSFSSSVSRTSSSSSVRTPVTRIAKDLIKLQNQRSGSNLSKSSSYSSNGGYISKIEKSILKSNAPIKIDETDEIEVSGERFLYANKNEAIRWKGPIPLSEYQINKDDNPEIITKKVDQKLEYKQEVAIRYLKPPTPPTPGEIVIIQEPNVSTPPAPPLVLRQQPPRPETPEPLVYREAPPAAPPQVGKKIIRISGKRLPAPPRKVVIERLAPLPSKPQSILVERWLPYNEVKRRVIFQKSNETDPVIVNPRNVIVQWEAPETETIQEFKYLGVINANPVDYVQRYSESLKTSNELPDFITNIKAPEGLVLAADVKKTVPYELEGDIEALKLVDLDKEGLAEYKNYLKTGRSPSVMSKNLIKLDNIVEKIFKKVNRGGNGMVSVEDAEKALLRINSRLSRRYGEDDVKRFFTKLDKDRDGHLNLKEFKQAFVNVNY